MFAALYFAQGLPSGLIAHALPAVLRDMGTSLALIGFLKLLALPWLFKFLWAPFVDRSKGNLTRARCRWIVSMQISSAITLVALAWALSTNSAESFILPLLLILLINTFCATQDIATDSLAVSLSSKGALGMINSIQVSGYKIGMIVGGSGCLLLLGVLSWQSILLAIAAVLIILLVPLYLFMRGEAQAHKAAVTLSSSDRSPDEAVSPHDDNQNSLKFIYSTYRRFFAQSNLGVWLWVLVTYKIADSLGSTMLKPMLVDQHWSLADIGELTLYSSLVGLVGAALAGILFTRIGRFHSLVWFGLLQMLSVGAFYFISTGTVTGSLITWLVCFEQFSDGLSTVALFACMMAHCRESHEGADYTVQASLQIVLAGIFGAASGLIAQTMSYQSLYVLCCVVGVVAMMLVLRYVASAGRFVVDEKKIELS